MSLGAVSNEDRSLHSIIRKYWFLTALLLGAMLRAHFVFNTSGTLDVEIWESHVNQIARRGLVGTYQHAPFHFNHPPPMGVFLSWLNQLGESLGIPFTILLRAPFAVFDAGSTWLILQLRRGRPDARVFAALYWLHPLSLIYSSYHGNTDTSVAFFLLATLLCVVRKQPLAAGALLGLSLWCKLPGGLMAPALLCVLPSRRERGQFAVAMASVGLLGYAPALLQDARAVIEAVFLYPGLNIRTGADVSIWGFLNWGPQPTSLPESWRLGFADLRAFLLRNNTWICLAPMLALAWLRRGQRDAAGISSTIASSYALFYGLTQNWAFQYFAWSLPFWLLAGWRFCLPASLLSIAYVYGLYAWLCGSLWLLGPWDFLGRPEWPIPVLVLRDLDNLFFLGAGLAALAQAARSEWRIRVASP